MEIEEELHHLSEKDLNEILRESFKTGRIIKSLEEYITTITALIYGFELRNNYNKGRTS